MNKRWYFPSWSGDYRLEATSEQTCTLTVVDPTAAEFETLGLFLSKAREKRWVHLAAGVTWTGTTSVEIKTPIHEAANLLLTNVSWLKGSLTAIRSGNGKVEVVSGTDIRFLGLRTTLKPSAPPAATLPTTTEVAAQVANATAVVTSPRPTLCCPQTLPGPELRASEVLQEFSTDEQWTSWERHGHLTCYGSLTGHAYRVAHRHSPIAQWQGMITWDLDDDHIVHCHNRALPAPEEVLAVKLVLEHRENWIRNPSGYLVGGGLLGGGGLHADVWTNPFMSSRHQVADGLRDAAFIAAIGDGILGALQALAPCQTRTAHYTIEE